MQGVNGLPFIPMGKIKRKGVSGPKYEVGTALLQLEDGDWLVEIRMLETGEQSEYRLSLLQDDPDAY
jgi:hypothetical protein